MKISYDKTAGVLYFKILENKKIIETEEVRDGVNIDLDKDNQVIGIEMLFMTDPKLQDELKNLSIQFLN